jgi:hypothetical protein
MDDKMLVTYCGLYCDLCSARFKIPDQAHALRESLRMADFEDHGPGQPNFNEFWAFLNNLAEPPPGQCCRAETCGHPQCAIRNCAKEKQLFVCTDCGDYPCEHILVLGRSEPTLVQDGRRLEAIGLEAWIAEQKARRRAGFCYGDVRCGKCTVPLDK